MFFDNSTIHATRLCQSPEREGAATESPQGAVRATSLPRRTGPPVSAKQLARGLAAEHPTRPRPKGNDITEVRATLPSGGARPFPIPTKEAARKAYLNPTTEPRIT